MNESLKKLLQSPYLAPVAQPLKNVARFTYTPVREFTEAVRDAWRAGKGFPAEPPLVIAGRTFGYLMDGGAHTRGITLFGMVLGGVYGGIAGATAWSAATASAGAVIQTIVAGGAGLTVAGLGVVAGPFLLAGVVAVVGGAAGLALGIAPGIVSGVKQTIKHIKDPAPTVVEIPPPASPRPGSERLKKLNGLVDEFRRLKKSDRVMAVKMVNEEYADLNIGKGEKLLREINTLPQAEQEEFVRGLRKKMAEMFEKVAEKDAKDAVKLDSDFIVGKPLKITPRRPKAKVLD